MNIGSETELKITSKISKI